MDMTTICLVCCVPWTENNKVEVSNVEKEFEQAQAQKTFKTFCEYLDVSSIEGRWSFSKEPLPFCLSCKDIIGYMFQLHNQLQSIQTELKYCVDNVKLKIEQSSGDLKSSILDERVSVFRSLLKSSDTAEVTARISRRQNFQENKNNEIMDTDNQTDIRILEESKETDDDEFDTADDNYDSDHKGKSRGKGSQRKEDKKNNSKARSVVKTSDGFSYGGHKFIQVSNGFECCECRNKVFKRKGGVLVHIRLVHLGERAKHICDLCGRACDSPFALKNHRSTHSEERNFFCHCGKAFKNAKNLKRHIVETHKMKLTEEILKTVKKQANNLLIFTNNCSKCGRGFIEESELEKHALGHKGEKYFKCYFCSTNYLQETNFQQHLSIEHNITVSN